MLQRILTVAQTVLLIGLLAGVSYAEAKVDLITRADVERAIINSEGKKEIVLVHASKADVVPGDVVIFTTIYRNIGIVPTDPGLTLDNPVPEHMVYMENTAVGTNMTITYSVDGGKSFDVPSRLYVIDKDGKKRKARPVDYTDIRWIMTSPLAPGVEDSVSFRAKVK